MSKLNVSSPRITHRALVVVADGAGARLFRNVGNESRIELVADGTLAPSQLNDDGPAGKSPPERSHRETDEATFAKQLAIDLNRRAAADDFPALVLITDRQTLGQIRPSLRKMTTSRLVLVVAKTLTKATVDDIEAALQ